MILHLPLLHNFFLLHLLFILFLLLLFFLLSFIISSLLFLLLRPSHPLPSISSPPLKWNTLPEFHPLPPSPFRLRTLSIPFSLLSTTSPLFFLLSLPQYFSFFISSSFFPTLLHHHLSPPFLHLRPPTFPPPSLSSPRCPSPPPAAPRVLSWRTRAATTTHQLCRWRRRRAE